MGPDIGAGAAIFRSEERFAAQPGSPSIDPSLGRAASLWTIDAGKAAQSAFPELDCLRGMLPARLLAAAELRAERLATGADRVLITAGTLDGDTYLTALGRTLGIALEPLTGISRSQCPLSDNGLIDAATSGVLPLTTDAGVVMVIAPRGTAAREIIGLIRGAPEMAPRFRFTSAERINRFVMSGAGTQLAAKASERLKRDWPMLSAASAYRLGSVASLTSVVTMALAGFALAPGVMAHIFEIGLATMFVAWLGLRLIGAFLPRPMAAPVDNEVPDATLPIYSVICALYREGPSVNALLSALENLDYPPEKLDVILAVEADDRETRAAIAARKTRRPVTVIAVPAIGPRTKPKALNVALPFARGAFTVVYDAEDRPEPDQLRCALQAFRAAGDQLACVQARLCIDNTADSALARYFTAEYAGQFDVFLPGLTAMGLPLPLGGSSNHFNGPT